MNYAPQNGTHSTVDRPKRDTTHNEIRQMVRQILLRSKLTVEKSTTGKLVSGPVVTFQVSGEGVKAPFNRYYLGKKLDKKLDNTGYHAELRRKDRGEDSIFIDLFVGERDQAAA